MRPLVGARRLVGAAHSRRAVVGARLAFVLRLFVEDTHSPSRHAPPAGRNARVGTSVGAGSPLAATPVRTTALCGPGVYGSVRRCPATCRPALVETGARCAAPSGLSAPDSPSFASTRSRVRYPVRRPAGPIRGGLSPSCPCAPLAGSLRPRRLGSVLGRFHARSVSVK